MKRAALLVFLSACGLPRGDDDDWVELPVLVTKAGDLIIPSAEGAPVEQCYNSACQAMTLKVRRFALFQGDAGFLGNIQLETNKGIYFSPGSSTLRLISDGTSLYLSNSTAANTPIFGAPVLRVLAAVDNTGLDFANGAFIRNSKSGVNPVVVDDVDGFRVQTGGVSVGNEILLTPAASGSNPTISITGVDSVRSLALFAKGAGGIFQFGYTSSGTSNELCVAPGSTGNAGELRICSTSVDTNSDLAVTARGTGVVTTNHGFKLSATPSHDTCASGREGEKQRFGGGTSGERTRWCLCTSDGAGTPVYSWVSEAGDLGTTTTCPIQSTIYTGTKSAFDFASIGPDDCQDTSVTVTGTSQGMPCALGVTNAAMGTNSTKSTFECWVDDNDTVKIRHCCHNGIAAGTCNPASADYKVRLWAQWLAPFAFGARRRRRLLAA